MEFIVNRKYLKMTPGQIARLAGYGFIRDSRSGKESFVKRLGRDNYPRFHLYIKEKEDRLIFNLHLDQKKVSYQGQRAHSGEYEGGLVEQEIFRLKKIISDLVLRDKN